MKIERKKMKPMKPGMKKFLTHLVAFLAGLGAVFAPPQFRPLIHAGGEMIEEGVEAIPEEVPEYAADSDSDE